MSLIQWTPRTRWMDFPRWVNNFFDDDLLRDETPGFTTPPVNVVEDEKEFILEVAAPGMEKKDIQVRVEKGSLVIEAEMKTTTEEKDDKYTRREFNFNAFRRTFWLPENVNADKIKADYQNGLLMLHLPKKVLDEVTTNKTISIN